VTVQKTHDDTRFSPPARRIIWTVPNLISFIRIISIPIIGYFIATNQLITSLIVMALSAASDGLDGYVARKFNQVSVLGQMLDPIADRLLIICSAIALAIVHIVPWWLMIIICCRDFVMGLEILLLAQYGYGPLPVHFIGKVGTCALLVAVPILIASHIFIHYHWVFYAIHAFGLACCWWGIGLYWIAGFIYFSQGFILMKKEHQH